MNEHLRGIGAAHVHESAVKPTKPNIFDINTLPKANHEAFFPPTVGLDDPILRNEISERAGDNNLACTIQYGSLMTGDKSPTSILDIILIVNDTEKFHKKNKAIAAKDYGWPVSTKWHNWLNKFGFNFYLSDFPSEKGTVKIKYAVISIENFIKGCNGSLREKEENKMGDFGLYVAGRMQKVALKPFFKTLDGEKIMEIQRAINSARIDGIWLTLGVLKEKFSFGELLENYISLSYKADCRPEKGEKVKAMMENGYENYFAMLEPILKEFVKFDFIQPLENGNWKKLNFPNRNDVKKRLLLIKMKTFLINYIKNPTTTGVDKGVMYALEKINRTRGLASKKPA